MAKASASIVGVQEARTGGVVKTSRFYTDVRMLVQVDARQSETRQNVWMCCGCTRAVESSEQEVRENVPEVEEGKDTVAAWSDVTRMAVAVSRTGITR